MYVTFSILLTTCFMISDIQPSCQSQVTQREENLSSLIQHRCSRVINVRTGRSEWSTQNQLEETGAHEWSPHQQWTWRNNGQHLNVGMLQTKPHKRAMTLMDRVQW